MKAPAFEHLRAASVAEAVALLLRHGEGAKLLAGGQSLLPALNLRLAAPTLLVDIGGIAALRAIAFADGKLRLGALVRHVELARSPVVATHAPLLAQAAPHIAHPAIRNRGTLGGSLAHADPAAEWPACMVALAATILVSGPAGERRITAADFFRGVFTTALMPDEILLGVELDATPAPVFFGEFSRRAGDFALAGLAAIGGPAPRLAFFGVGDAPVATPRTAALLADPLAAEAMLAAELACRADLHASSATRLQLAKVLLRRAIVALA